MTQNIKISDLRIPYGAADNVFDVDHLAHKEPFGQFAVWLKEALEHQDVVESNAMALATADRSGKPSVRFLLLKEFDERGFQFYTSSDSRKGRDLTENPQASMCFYWKAMNRQVRVEGHIEMLTNEETETYFCSRPRPSQISACASQQSSVLPNRQVLVDKFKSLSDKYGTDVPIKKPDTWLGYRLIPESVEFWQGQTTRLHDRIRFRRKAEGEIIDSSMTHEGTNGWYHERLSP